MNPLKIQFKELIDYLRIYLLNPIEEMKKISFWPWNRILIFQISITVTLGALTGLMSRGRSILFSAISSVSLSWLFLALATLFFQYAFQAYADRRLDYKQLYQTVLFASLPLFFFQILSDFFALIPMIGLGFTALLLSVGLIENFSLPRRLVIQVIGAIAGLFVIIILMNLIQGKKSEESFRSRESAPEVHLGR
jgi:hypothetical protein